MRVTGVRVRGGTKGPASRAGALFRRPRPLSSVLLALIFLASGGATLHAAPGDAVVPRDVRIEMEALRSRNPGRRVRAAIRLGGMGERAAPAVPSLIRMLEDETPVRTRGGGESSPARAAAEALVKIGGPSEGPPAAALADDEGAGAGGRSSPGVAGAMRFGIGGGIYPPIRRGEEAMRAVTRTLDELGPVWLRHPGKGSSWREVQPTRTTWDFRKLDAVLEGNGHPWMFFVYGAVGTAYPFGADLTKEHMDSLGGRKAVLKHIIENAVDLDDPVQRADAETYAKALVGRYRDRVRHWEIRNEGISAPEALPLAKSTYRWIGETDPEASVLAIAVAGDDDATFRKGIKAFGSMLAEGYGDYFDIGNFHYYERTGSGLEERCEEKFDEYRAVMDSHGALKPIWVTETATSSAGTTKLSGKSSEREQARDVVKRLVVFSAKGAEKVIWYNYRTTHPGDKFYGCNLIDEKTGVPKPAYRTFKLLVEKVGDYGKVETLRRDAVRLYRFTTAGGEPVLVAWSGSPGAAVLDVGGYLGGGGDGAGKVRVTHIIEDEGAEPAVETVPGGAVRVSESPVFIEKIEAKDS